MGIKAVVTDFGGVLVRTGKPVGRQKWDSILKLEPGTLERLVFGSEEAAKATLGELPESAIWESLAAKFQLDSQAIRQLEDDFWSDDRLDTVLVEFLESLRPAYQIAILSNAWPNARRSFKERYRLDRLADPIIISAEEGLAKPDPRIFERTAARLGAEMNGIVFLDDFPLNVRAAASLGIHAVQFRSTAQAIEDIKRILSLPQGN